VKITAIASNAIARSLDSARAMAIDGVGEVFGFGTVMNYGTK
jgi:hypothetical protein